jgi:hypothetical protein
MGLPGAIKGRVSCGVCSGSRTEQWKSGEELLQVHHLTRYELGDGEGDDLGRTGWRNMPAQSPVMLEITTDMTTTRTPVRVSPYLPCQAAT